MNRSTVMLVVALLACRCAPAATRSQSFDDDPNWDGRNNRYAATTAPTEVKRDFGYSPTHYAGAAPGEIGGEFRQASRPASYAKKIDPPRTLDDRMSASGSVAVLHAQSVSGWHTACSIFVGFFDADERSQIWRPANFVGFLLHSINEPDGCGVDITYGTSGYQAGGISVNAAGGGQDKNPGELEMSKLLRLPPDESKHTWALDYNPASGEIVLRFDGNETRLKIPAEHRKAGAKMNRFGLFTPRIPGHNIVAYFDDVTIDGQKEDFSKDPGWIGVGNREKYQDRAQYGWNDFGFSRTHYAGGARGGELGGRFYSCNPDEEPFKAHYGDRIGHLTLDDHLVAQGKFAAKEFSIDSTFALGWFNAEKQGWPIENFVGVYFDSLTDTGRIVQPLYGTRAGNKQRDAGWVQFVPDGTAYDWKLEYDPDAADGRGQIAFTLGGQTVKLALKEGARKTGAVFDRFGVFNLQWANSKWCEVYLDDLTYTVGGP